MNIKKKLAMSIATGALAVSMIGGGTYAYFSSETSTTSAFAAGTLNMAVNPSVIIDIKDLKPGDYMDRHFTLENTGSLDISEILLGTSYSTDVADFANHIVVEFLKNEEINGPDYEDSVIFRKTLAELANERPDLVEKLTQNIGHEDAGLESGDSDKLIVRFLFKDTGENNQNHLQGAKLDLTWTFTSKQYVGYEAK